MMNGSGVKLIAAGLANDGEIDLIDFTSMTRVLKISNGLLVSFEDFIIEEQDNEYSV